jgi:hypothetical protein
VVFLPNIHIESLGEMKYQHDFTTFGLLNFIELLKMLFAVDLKSTSVWSLLILNPCKMIQYQCPGSACSLSPDVYHDHCYNNYVFIASLTTRDPLIRELLF